MVDMSGEGMFTSIIRSIFASLDSFVYKLLAGIYNVFFNVATADVLKAELVKNLFGRIQIILGVIILFKLVISFFSGVVDPDSLNDKKNGVGSVIKRVVVVLVMLLMIVPLNIPEANTGEEGMGSWNKNMNTHGILFGSLYELQRRILKDNIIFKAINGNSGGMSETTRTNVGESFAKDVLKTFLTVNVVYDGADFSDQCEGKNDYRDTNCVCTRWKNEARTDADSDINVVYPVYFDPDSTIDMLLQSKVVTAYCDDNSDEMSYAALQEEGKDFDERATTKFNDDTYALSYSYLWSTIIGVLFCVLILSLTIDVAVRLFKLVLLQIISPVAILSYIDPSSEKTFKNWTKSLTETYLSVFIRVAIISLILFIVNNISLTGFGLNISNGFVGFVSKILIYFGLIMFAKEAPKFITQSLGIESKEGNGLFSGFGKILGATTMTRGIVGSAISDAKVKYGERLENPKTANHRIRNVASSIISGITGGVGGAVTGTKALATADKDYSNAVMNAQKNRTQLRASHSTGFGRWADKQSQLFTGQSLADRDTASAEVYNDVFNKSRAVKEALESETKKHGKYGEIGERKFNYERLLAAINTADQNGNFKYRDSELKVEYDLNAADFDANTLNTLLESQIRNYQAGETRDGATAAAKNGIIVNAQLELNHAVNKAGPEYKATYNKNENPGGFDNVKSLIGKSATDKTKYATEQKHIKHMANKQANDKK